VRAKGEGVQHAGSHVEEDVLKIWEWLAVPVLLMDK
jgi:hypothetical protein